MISVDTFDHIFLFSKIAITLFEEGGLFEDISEAFFNDRGDYLTFVVNFLKVEI